MQKRSVLAIVGVAFATMVVASFAGSPNKAIYIGSLRWTDSDGLFGGFSGLEVAANGLDYWVISDGGIATAGRFERDTATGELTGAGSFAPKHLQNLSGMPVKSYWNDAEGLAIGGNGEFYVSFEGEHRVWRYDHLDGLPVEIPQHRDFKEFQNNSALEVLAIDGTGAIFTLPERSGVLTFPFPVYRFRGNKWDQPFGIERRSPYLPVGGDFGPDGKFYLLERHLNGIFGFQSRVRRFTFTETSVADEETLLESATGEHDNLEGISVWRDGAGRLRITMISDDNYKAFQKTEFVEYWVPD